MTTRDFLFLELKLISRNIRPKVLLCFSAMVFVVMYSPPTSENGYMKSLLFIFVTSCFAVYAQFWLAWDAAYFGLLMSIPNSIKPYIEAKFWMNLIYVLLITLIFLPFSYTNGFASYLLSGFLYNASLSAYIMIYFALYNTAKLDLWKSEILFEGIIASQYLASVVYFGLPCVLCFGFNYLFSPKIMLLFFGITGFIFLILYKPILNLLVAKFMKRKKILLESYNTQ